MAGQLTAKQAAFAEHYIRCKNATDSARLAGYAGDDNALAVIGHRNLRNAKIRDEIARLASLQAMPPSEVIERLTEHARIDMSDFIKIQAGLPFIDLEKAKQAAKLHQLKKFKVTKQGVEIELYDAQAALVQLGRHYGLFTDKVQVDDWRTQAIADIKAGSISYKALAEAFDNDLATELFTRAGVPISSE